MIKLINVSKEISNKKILNNINLSIEEGKIYGLIGCNGSGKTMLLRIICDLIKPSSGEIIRKSDLTYGVIIENPGFMYEETAFFNLKYLASINNKIDEKRIDEVLTMLDLFEYRKMKVKKYSLGMQQKLGIAQAIMEYPKILLLDEPFNALDTNSYYKVKSILLTMKEKYNTTIIIATHDKSSKDMFDYIIEMDNGNIVNF